MKTYNLFVNWPRLHCHWYAFNFTLFLTLIGFSFTCHKSYARDMDEWQANGERKNIRLFIRDYPDSNIPEFKAIVQIPSTMATVLAVLLDVEKSPQWIHQCGEASLLDQPSAFEKIIYQVNEIPLAKDRDFILRAQLSFAENAESVRIKLETSNDFCLHQQTDICQRINQSKYVRIKHLIGEYHLRQISNKLIEVTWQQFVDPGGKLPSWIIKSQIDNIAFKTLDSLRKQVKQSEYKDAQLRIVSGELEIY